MPFDVSNLPLIHATDVSEILFTICGVDYTDPIEFGICPDCAETITEMMELLIAEPSNSMVELCQAFLSAGIVLERMRQKEIACN